MTIEATLLSIDGRLGAILIALNAGARAVPVENIEAGEAAVALAGLTNAQQEPVSGGAPAKRGRGAAKTTGSTTTTVPAADPVKTAPVVEAAIDFLSLGGEPEVAEKVVTLAEVRAALFVLTTKVGQGEAMKVFKTASGVETLAKLTSASYAAVFNAAIPSGKIDIQDVRAVLVAANERVANSGLAVLKQNGANTIAEVTPDKFVKVIIDAYSVK